MIWFVCMIETLQKQTNFFLHKSTMTLRNKSYDRKFFWFFFTFYLQKKLRSGLLTNNMQSLSCHFVSWWSVDICSSINQIYSWYPQSHPQSYYVRHCVFDCSSFPPLSILLIEVFCAYRLSWSPPCASQWWVMEVRQSHITTRKQFHQQLSVTTQAKWIVFFWAKWTRDITHYSIMTSNELIFACVAFFFFWIPFWPPIFIQILAYNSSALFQPPIP